MDVILVFVKDCNTDCKYDLWEIYSEYVSNEQIEEDIQEAKKHGIIRDEAEYYTERWTVNDY